MTESTIQPTYILHPKTREVYRIPSSAIVFDPRNPSHIPYKNFEELTTTQTFCAEHIAHSIQQIYGTFPAEETVVIEYAQSDHTSHRRYLWGVRVSTTFPATEAFASRGLVGSVGGDFVWIRAAGRAWNHWVNRRDAILNPSTSGTPTDAAHDIDNYPPDNAPLFTSYPDGSPPYAINGCVLVETLTPKTHFFLSCIQPIDSVCSRRIPTEDWESRFVASVERRQSKDPARTLRWEKKHALSSLTNESVRDFCIRKVLETHSRESEKMQVEAKLLMEKKRNLSIARRLLDGEEGLVAKRTRSSNHSVLEARQLVHSTTDKNHSFGKLPDDLAALIFKHVVHNAMMAGVNECKNTLASMLMLSKTANTVCYETIREQVASLSASIDTNTTTGSPTKSVDLGFKFRKIGLTPHVVLKFGMNDDVQPKDYMRMRLSSPVDTVATSIRMRASNLEKRKNEQLDALRRLNPKVTPFLLRM